jgi:altronate hydrolase
LLVPSSGWLRTDRRDDVAVALDALAQGAIVAIDGYDLEITQPIPAGHKFALRALAKGDPVRRYGERIGIASHPVVPGSHVHSHNLSTALSGELRYRYSSPVVDAPIGAEFPREFLGYRRADGTIGTRNEIWVLPTVGCVGRLAERLAANAPSAPGVDGVHAFNHPFGCSQLGADRDDTAAILAALARNPNAGGVVLVGLGCESNQIDALMDRIPAERHDRIEVVRSQAAEDEYAAGTEAIARLATVLARDVREPVPLASLRLGVKCGGSDGMSGLTANPLIGRVADRVVAAGGTVLLTEIPEMFGAEHLLMARAVDEQVFDRLVGVVNRFKRYYLDHGEPVSENPSPGNIEGGITTLEEKSLGAVQKGGVAPVTDVLHYAERLRRTGLSVVEAPGNDAVSTTALAAAGATMTLFSTGRGTPLGSPVPTLKLASNHLLARRKANWIDFDAAALIDDGPEAATKLLLDLVIATASGRPTRNERNDERSIGIWKRGVTL